MLSKHIIDFRMYRCSILFVAIQHKSYQIVVYYHIYFLWP